LLSYLKAITLDPDQPDTLMAIANICLEKGDFETAIEYYIAAQALDDTLEFVNLFIAVAKFKTGNIKDTISYLQKAVLENETAAALFLELCPEAVDSSLLTTKQ